MLFLVMAVPDPSYLRLYMYNHIVIFMAYMVNPATTT